MSMVKFASAVYAVTMIFCVQASANVCNLGMLNNVTGALVQATKKDCQNITSEDLLKITELVIINEPAPGTLVGLSNLRKLTIQAWPNMGHWIYSDIFKGLDSLETFVFEGNSANIDLYPGAFKGLSNLKSIQIKPQGGYQANGRIYSEAFAGIPSLEIISLSTPCGSVDWSRNYYWYAKDDAFSGVSAEKLQVDMSCVKPL